MVLFEKTRRNHRSEFSSGVVSSSGVVGLLCLWAVGSLAIWGVINEQKSYLVGLPLVEPCCPRAAVISTKERCGGAHPGVSTGLD